MKLMTLFGGGREWEWYNSTVESSHAIASAVEKITQYVLLYYQNLSKVYKNLMFL